MEGVRLLGFQRPEHQVDTHRYHELENLLTANSCIQIRLVYHELGGGGEFVVEGEVGGGEGTGWRGEVGRGEGTGCVDRDDALFDV